MKKIIFAAFIYICVSNNIYANTITEPAFISDMMMSWSPVLNRRIVIDLPKSYNLLLRKEIIISNEKQLDCMLQELNDIYMALGLAPIDAVIYNDTVVIKQMNIAK